MESRSLENPREDAAEERSGPPLRARVAAGDRPTEVGGPPGSVARRPSGGRVPVGGGKLLKRREDRQRRPRKRSGLRRVTYAPATLGLPLRSDTEVQEALRESRRPAVSEVLRAGRDNESASCSVEAKDCRERATYVEGVTIGTLAVADEGARSPVVSRPSETDPVRRPVERRGVLPLRRRS